MKSLLLGLALLFCTVLGSMAAEPAPPSRLPRLVDLGADKCIPCKLMAPVLAELAKDYAGQLDVVFIDVWKNHAEGERYAVRVIPTQIFYDAAGKERFRHEGFMAKKDILAKWTELGVELKVPVPEKKN
ncbi:MAG: thioredoxin family protein [Opitutaceae bacterium]|jgi:thioredoxin 1